MKIFVSIILPFFFCTVGLAQTGHVMQGVGAPNFTMGGASTGQSIDEAGTLLWNPAGITSFYRSRLSVNAGFFFAAPEIESAIGMPDGQGGFISLTGSTNDEMGMSVLPSVGYVSGTGNGKFAWGISAFGISGFGVDYPAETSLPGTASFNPAETNAVTLPQQFGGFGRILSEYQLLQLGVTAAYKLTDRLSIGIAPTFNYASLEIQPNPLASPSPQLGYPLAEASTAFGYGAQVGLYYGAELGLKLGASYKTTQYFQDFEMEGAYLTGTAAPTVNFNMEYPAIASIGLGYSTETIDLAVDVRRIFYEETNGFRESGWTQTASVQGFGWKNVDVIAAGIQYTGIDRLPLRFGYTYSSNPISEDGVFFSAPAPAIIENAVQFGFGFEVSESFSISAGIHRGLESEVSGPVLNPMLISGSDPLGRVPGSNVTSRMNTTLALVSLSIGL